MWETPTRDESLQSTTLLHKLSIICLSFRFLAFYPYVYIVDILVLLLPNNVAAPLPLYPVISLESASQSQDDHRAYLWNYYYVLLLWTLLRFSACALQGCCLPWRKTRVATGVASTSSWTRPTPFPLERPPRPRRRCPWKGGRETPSRHPVSSRTCKGEEKRAFENGLGEDVLL